MNLTYTRLMDELKELHDAKANDYAEEGNPYSNFEYAAQVAEDFTDSVDRVFATMIGIKLARIAQLKRAGRTPNHESVRDSLKDATAYFGIWTSYEEDRVLILEDREEAIAKTFVSHLQMQQE